MADEGVADRMPTAIRYLQIGLLEEGMTPVLVVPDSERCLELSAGPTSVVAYQPDGWFHIGRERSAVESILAQLTALKIDTPPLVHCLNVDRIKLAGQLATRTDGQMIANLWAHQEASAIAARRGDDLPRVILAPSEAIAKELRAVVPADCKVVVAPLGVSQEPPSTPSQRPDQKPALVYAGPLSPNSGLFVALRAVRQVLRTHPWLMFFVIGKGPAEMELRAIAESLGISENVVFTGRVEYLRSVLSDCHVFCIPDWEGGYREELLHALSAGMAVIAVAGGPYDGLADEDSILSYPAGDEDALALRIDRLLREADLGGRLGRSAFDLARRAHSVTRMVDGYASVYRELYNRHRTLPIHRANA